MGANSIELMESGIAIKGAQATATGSLEASGATAKVAGTASLELDGRLSAMLKGDGGGDRLSRGD